VRALDRQRWWLLRVVALPVHLLVFTVVTFLLVRSVPGDPVLNLLQPGYSQADYDRVQAALGLDGSIWRQLLDYLHGVVTFDLGTSLSTGTPVLSEFRTRLPATVEFAVQGLLVTLLLTLVFSYVIVLRPRWPLAGVLRAYARTAGALPEYVLAIIALFVFYVLLHWAPAPLGRLSVMVTTPATVTGFPLLDTILTGSWPAMTSMLGHLVVPVLVMAVSQTPILLRLMVSGLEESLAAAPTTFRIAAGASHAAVLASVYRRALPPTVTMTGTLFGYMLGGAVVLETLFGFAGLGKYAVDAVNTSDYVATQGVLLVVATLSLVVFLVVDLLNMTIDPRRRTGSRTEA
jgi:peptide/nickel transport system permease protein